MACEAMGSTVKKSNKIMSFQITFLVHAKCSFLTDFFLQLYIFKSVLYVCKLGINSE